MCLLLWICLAIKSGKNDNYCGFYCGLNLASVIPRQLFFYLRYFVYLGMERKELITRLVKDGHITLDEAVMLLNASNMVIMPYIQMAPVYPNTGWPYYTQPAITS